jgi:hypothetical protein
LCVVFDLFDGRESSFNQDETDEMSHNLFEELVSNFCFAQARYIFPTLLLSYGVYLSGKGTLPSTYICSVASGGAYSVPLSQVAGVFLDAIVIFTTWGILKDMDLKQRLATVASIVLYLAIALILLSITYVLFNTTQGSWFLNLHSISLWSALKDGLALATVLFCAIYVASELRPLDLVILLVFSCVYTLQTMSIWSTPRTFPPQPKTVNSIGLVLILVGFHVFMNIYGVSEVSKASSNFAKRVPTWMYLLLATSLVPTQVMIILRTPVAGPSHPIFSLTYNARIEGDRWRVQASSSISLETAVREYRLRHRNRTPPPNFDKWYEFAMARGCPVIDDYDQIDRDLLPFWAIEPDKIRMLSPAQSPQNGIVAVAIRSGQVIYDNYDDSDKEWSPNETISMMETFAQWLPDMNIGINVRQFPRMTMPWKQLELLRLHALTAKSSVQDSEHRKDFEPNWPIPFLWNANAKDRIEAIMAENKKTPSSPLLLKMPEPSGPVCSPNSPFGRSKAWDKYDFCASCAEPHSLGQFVKNWTLAGDICHQPDMVNLHGFLASLRTAASRKKPRESWGNASEILVPIFSRSKLSGYNDILIPGTADYVDLNKERPHQNGYYELLDSLYWAGPADEGESLAREWQGMQQQRLVHLANNIRNAGVIPMVLPSVEGENFVYENVPNSEVAQLFNMDIAFTSFEHCSVKDCQEQRKEFGTNDTALNQEWNYRYVFDLDTHGASEKFVSYLHSHSLPFRASIFRTWYDDRLTPWLHFVPIDSRLQAVHSTLAYFTGLKGILNGRNVEMKSNGPEAEFIAGQGRKWAEKALRKEDAEAYLFRLLLEWGRVTDDRRDEIGYEK